MNKRRVTPHPVPGQLVCGHLKMGMNYTNWRPRGSEDWLLIYTESGSGQFQTREGVLHSQPGDAVLYAPGDMQDYGTSITAGTWELSWVHFRPRRTWEKFLKWPAHSNGLRHLVLMGTENQADFVAALHAMLDFAWRTLPVADDLAMAALEQVLIWSFVAVGNEARHSDARVRRAADYLAWHLKEPFDLESLAGYCNLSVSRLSHLFKEQMGITPQQFQERQRMRHACDLLRLTGMSVAEVAREVGYDDPFYFSNRFRRNLGVSPLGYRKGEQT